MPNLVWLNGEIMPLEEARIPAADHAHLYGDGIFEGIRIYNRSVWKLDEHLERLYHGLSYLQFDMQVSRTELRAVILDVCRQANINDGYIRLNVTRGTGLGLDPAKMKSPNVMVMISELKPYPAEAYEVGLRVVSTTIRVIPADCLDPRVKCLGKYASNILAKLEANRAGVDEALMLNHQGHVAECTVDNIFLISKGVIRTPHPSCGILQGVTRDVAIGIAREFGYTVDETFLTPFDVFAADEAFLTGTAAEVIPMVSMDNQKIGCGTPGPITQKIIARFRELTQTTGVPF